MTIASASRYEKVNRLWRITNAADYGNNPMQRPTSPSAPTVTSSATSDGTLTNLYSLAASGALTAAVNQVNFYGGTPTAVNTVYVAMPVVSQSPSTASNIGAGLNSLNSWASAIEVETDSPTIQFAIFTDNAKQIMFQVNGQYTSFTGTTGPGSSADTYFKLVFASAGIRRIRVLIPTNPATGPSLLKNIRTLPLYSIWKPSLKDVIKVGWTGDSYTQGTNASATIYPIPNAAWPVMACELLGFRDCRQLGVGGTGYLATNSGTFAALQGQIANWPDQGPYDLFVVTAGYNDAPPSFTAGQITIAVTAYLTALRLQFPLTPIVILGTQCGAGGPNANQLSCEAAILAGYNAYIASNPDTICKYAPVSADIPTWLNGTGFVGATNSTGNSDTYVDTDATHPTVAGAQYLAYRSAKAVRQAIAQMLNY